MYVSKGKPKICTHYISQTDEPKPRITKIGTGLLGPNLTPSAKFGSDRFTEDGASRPQFHVDFGFFLYFFMLFFYFLKQCTDQTAWPIFAVNSSNDVFSRKEVPFGVHVDMRPQLWAWLPKNMLFGPFFDKTWFAMRNGLKLTYQPNWWSDFCCQGLKWWDSMSGIRSPGWNFTNFNREGTVPQNQKNEKMCKNQHSPIHTIFTSDDSNWRAGTGMEAKNAKKSPKIGYLATKISISAPILPVYAG